MFAFSAARRKCELYDKPGRNGLTSRVLWIKLYSTKSINAMKALCPLCFPLQRAGVGCEPAGAQGGSLPPEQVFRNAPREGKGVGRPGGPVTMAGRLTERR